MVTRSRLSLFSKREYPKGEGVLVVPCGSRKKSESNVSVSFLAISHAKHHNSGAAWVAEKKGESNVSASLLAIGHAKHHDSGAA